MQIKDIMVEQMPATQTTTQTATQASSASTPAAQPVTPESLAKALMPLGVNIKSTSTPMLHQYFTKIGAKTTQLKKTGDPYADTILAMFGFELR